MTRTRVREVVLGQRGERVSIRTAEVEEPLALGGSPAARSGLHLLARWLVRQRVIADSPEPAMSGPAADTGKPGHSLDHRALTPAPTRALMSADE